ncbi:MAG: DUF3568 domain-containing protein [Candidatus Omnitrophica bacterium]|nr:DUF3568 domain-containing protein [Candidatus Omnitrophota bacterium]
MRYILWLGFILILGCTPLLVGTGVVTGYVLSNDSATGFLTASYRDVWDASIGKLEERKVEIIKTVESKGLIKAKLSDADITIKIYTIKPDIQKLRVSSRKYLLPKPNIAQEIFFAIIKELE